MATYAPERPTAVTVIGWGSIVLAVLMFLGGLAGVGSVVMMSLASQQAASDLPPGFDQMVEMLQPVVPLSFLQMGIAVVMLVASILLLRLRESGRLMLEALNWFGVVYTIGMYVWFVPAFSRTAARIAETLPDQPQPGSAMLGPAASMAIGAVQLVIIGVIIWVLRSKTVRDAMLPAGPPPPSPPPEFPSPDTEGAPP